MRISVFLSFLRGDRATTDVSGIGRQAALMISQHGQNASGFAARRALALAREGDSEGAAVWRQILEVIVLLQRERTPEEWLN